jgi:hypothetical protein
LPSDFRPFRRLKRKYEKIGQYLLKNPDAKYSKVMKATRAFISSASFTRLRNRMKMSPLQPKSICMELPSGFNPMKKTRKICLEAMGYLNVDPQTTFSEICRKGVNIKQNLFFRLRRAYLRSMGIVSRRRGGINIAPANFAMYSGESLKSYAVLATGTVPVSVEFLRTLIGRINKTCNVNLEVVEYKNLTCASNNERVEIRKAI